MQMWIAIYLMTSVLLNIVVGVIGVFAWVELKSFMKSTHQVQYVPLSEPAGEQKPVYRDEDLKEYDI